MLSRGPAIPGHRQPHECDLCQLSNSHRRQLPTDPFALLVTFLSPLKRIDQVCLLDAVNNASWRLSAYIFLFYFPLYISNFMQTFTSPPHPLFRPTSFVSPTAVAQDQQRSHHVRVVNADDIFINAKESSLSFQKNSRSSFLYFLLPCCLFGELLRWR